MKCIILKLDEMEIPPEYFDPIFLFIGPENSSGGGVGGPKGS